ncbi:MAG: carbohydrate porin [Candidatus Eiseniibacteriota bacterium]
MAASGAALGDDQGGLKSLLKDHGITPSLQYQGDGAVNAVGGARRGGTYLGDLQLQLQIDGGPLIGVPGLTLYLNGLDIHGGQASGFVGDAQGVSNIAGPPGFTPYEAWLQYNTLDRRLSVLAGLYDLNTEFYFLPSATALLNSSFGIGPEFAFTGVGGPSIYPATSLGTRVAYRATRNLLVRAAVLDGAPLRRPDGNWGVFESGDGALLVAELAYFVAPTPSEGTTLPIGRGGDGVKHKSKIALGGWYYTASFDDLSEVDAGGQPVRHRGSGGAYLVAEHNLIAATNDTDLNLAAFVQAGVGDSRVNRFGAYLGAGLVATNFVGAWTGDQVALGFAMARNGSHFMSAQSAQDIPTRRAETALELSYKAPVNDWLTLQPDVQYVVHPDTDPTQSNALVFQFQMTITFQ